MASTAASRATGRRLPKDAYDVLLVTMGTVDGLEEAVAGFGAEADVDSTGDAFALKALQRDFLDPGPDGPIRAAQFYPGTINNRDRIRENVAMLAKFLLGS